MYRSQPDIEAVVARIWQELLGIDVAAEDNFFDIGGDSLLVVEFLLQVREAGIGIKSPEVFTHPTAASLAEYVVSRDSSPAGLEPAILPTLHVTADEIWRTHLSPWDEAAPPCLVPLAPGGHGEPLYVVHWGNGAVRFAAAAAGTWAAGRPVFGFEAPGYRGDVRPLITIPDMAERYLDELREHQPAGPYFLTGVCQGSVVAFEMARRLWARAEQVTLAMVKPPTLQPWIEMGWGLDEILRFRVASLPERLSLSGQEGLDEVFSRMRSMGWYDDLLKPMELPRLQIVWSALAFSLHHYEPRHYEGRVISFQDRKDAEAMERGWAALPQLEPIWFDYGVESALPILEDPRVAEVMRQVTEG